MKQNTETDAREAVMAASNIHVAYVKLMESVTRCYDYTCISLVTSKSKYKVSKYHKQHQHLRSCKCCIQYIIRPLIIKI